MAEREYRIKVLCCVDGSEESKKAARLSGRFGRLTGAHITLFHVIDEALTLDEVPATEPYREAKARGEQILQEAKRIVEEEGGSCDTKMVVGPAVLQIVKHAELGDYDVICMGTRGMTGLKRMLLGSTADRVIRYAHCPVTVVR